MDFTEIRKTGIGGSDIAAIFGLSKYKTAYDLYLEKIGESHPYTETEVQYFGKILEDVVANEYSRRSGSKIKKSKKTYRHKKHKYLLAHIDRLVIAPENKILECKTSRFADSSEWGEIGSDSVPTAYLLQCQHYLNVLDYDKIDLAVLIAGQEFRIYSIERNQKLIDAIENQASIFWDKVTNKTPPDPVTLGDLQKKYPYDNGESLIGTPEIINTVERLREIKLNIKELESEEEILKQAIASELKDKTYLLDSTGNEILSYKATRQNRIDSKYIKEHFPEIYESCKTEILIKKFNLKKVK